MSWRDGRVWRPSRTAAIAVVLIGLAALVGLVVLRDDDSTVVTSDDASAVAETTTSEATTTSTEAPTTSTAPTTTTTTIAPTTTAAPPTTATPPPATSAPPSLPPPPPATTMPASPTEFRATVRGHDQGPDYYGLFYGTAYGGGGGFQVTARCQAGTVRVTVIEDGWTSPPPDIATYPSQISVYAGDTPLAEFREADDGLVVAGPVGDELFIRWSGPTEHDVRVSYDCRG